ncbi:UTP--glucose-1-phosphate uridylyltransferase GalU [Paenibacillus alginolyticus]|uniref:UTP--glucose-1-phosphate uridylyltransferase n=1 Tax=Paenibacillus alginolyticus TaxID=59839 RepID=A0ABT4GJD3_9BACL|nr:MULTISPECIES: UTP--glucose-1-phosphate uridylyltransferase GalU [Paenibacillus]MCY9668021.1 UTP--glucose-1-phosphate uridylyltransferase GalU [Paenibacillus alginolyticus]MCY9696301.1 UTP--glucose-1-phosphate uridylyltransferase GalU [Paenibacillus alginolyticus]MEC0142576.1 UTP--glucose-1-phosphate uridylyltransferase GalU [Paenibacillus alginolyticus]NRF92781.1 UTP--glucose-1-phosphate uridylyltransferase GalU [Paenibacillus frigoriresistens]
MKKIRKAIIPAAGLGTRFLPATKAQPKEMLPIVDKPAIQYIVEEAIESGIEDIIIVTGRNKRAIEDHFDKSVELEMMLEEKGSTRLLEIVQSVSNLADVHYIRQKQPLGLGHAILCARKFIGDEPFAVLLGDDILQSSPPGLKQMMDIYEQSETSVIAVQEVPWEDVSKYGIVSPASSLDKYQLIEDLVEKPDRDQAPSNLAVIGRYIIMPEIFGILERQEPGRGGEIQLTDALRVLNRQQQMAAYLMQAKRYDVGDKMGYIEATIELALQRPDLQDQVKAYLLSLIHQLELK